LYANGYAKVQNGPGAAGDNYHKEGSKEPM